MEVIKITPNKQRKLTMHHTNGQLGRATTDDNREPKLPKRRDNATITKLKGLGGGDLLNKVAEAEGREDTEVVLDPLFSAH